MSDRLRRAGDGRPLGSRPGVGTRRGALAVPTLLGVLVLLVVPVTAGAAPDSLAGTDDADAVELLTRSAGARDRISYQGTQYVSAWSTLRKSQASASAVVKVRHQAGGPTEVGVQDTQTAILHGESGTTWLADGGGPVDLLIGAYDVYLVGEASVAGRRADVVEARRADGSLAARLWLDRQTALSLRRETYTTAGQLLNASAFVDISITPAPTCCVRHHLESAWPSSPGRPAPAEPSGLRWEDITKLRENGFRCLETLGEDVVLYEARQLGDAVQLSYSDGVMSVSVFEQPGQLDPQRLDGYVPHEVGNGVVYTREGPPARFTWSSNGQVITVVADAPAEIVDDVLRAMPPENPEEVRQDDGLVARIGRGAQKVGSWLNPFG
ncbi:sigma-E factor regulatory protein RseB domain-containing protein [Phytoactinopolyspora halophila]|uniref:sigma-E factor regulatory protein RseB domain-containing protein n=1 Tax=Phytoactinopolyspora halophila TaxID=1981511 RepID=UPI001314B348|nr:sigma-E factor regulatory protein RseB domain-containing protein [Phytoactinopolyspora halophila]